MRIAIDIDDTITHAPKFFSALTQFIKAEIIIVSFRDNLEEALSVLQNSQISYDKVILSNDRELGRENSQGLSEWKAKVVQKIKADVFFEDMPEVIALVKPPTKVFMTIDKVMQEWVQENLSR
ncbi:hypothetical protein [Candidatus Uabimicrobium sp. HlEnr_7]|uniref:hypothetical protein n=1 Tax=Candidatus Uabimicrobium helgolandensis TaxID=3095367 RepID=UPI0035562CDA